jgi:thiol-disulfide isomerase/thioredoxin
MTGRTDRRRSPVRRRAAGAAMALLLAVATLGACSSSGSTSGSSDGTITIVPAGQRRDPIDLAGTTLDGARLDLTTLRGSVVVLNVWGSWCPPCRKEAPDLQRAYEQLEPAGVAFVGINFADPDPAPARLYVKRFGLTYPSLVDDGGTSLLALRGAVSASTIPSTLVLDAQGRIAARVTTAVTTATLVDLVDGVRARAAG